MLLFYCNIPFNVEEIPMQNALDVVNSATAAAGDLAVVTPTRGGDVIRQVAGMVDANPMAATGIAVVAAVGVGYLTYKAFSKEEK